MFSSIARLDFNSQRKIHSSQHHKFSPFFSIHNRTIKTLAASCIPFPDTKLAASFRDRYIKTDEADWTMGIVLGYPEVARRYWQVARTMQQQRMVPFVHGQAAMWSIPQRILKALGYSNCQLLRFANLANLPSSKELLHKIQTIAEERDRERKHHPIRSFFFRDCPIISSFLRDLPLDHRSEFRNNLLAMTIGLFYLERNESPFSFVFGGAYGCPPCYYRLPGNRNAMNHVECMKRAEEIITQAFEARGYDSSLLKENYRSQVGPLFEIANSFPIGQILVCGIPYDDLDKSIYHSEPLGFPTGHSLTTALERLSEGKFDTSSQARLLLTKDTLTDESAIRVVNIMDCEEVSLFCQSYENMHFDLGYDDGLKEYLSLTNPKGEENILNHFKIFHEQIDAIIQSFIRELALLKI